MERQQKPTRQPNHHHDDIDTDYFYDIETTTTTNKLLIKNNNNINNSTIIEQDEKSSLLFFNKIINQQQQQQQDDKDKSIINKYIPSVLYPADLWINKKIPLIIDKSIKLIDKDSSPTIEKHHHHHQHRHRKKHHTRNNNKMKKILQKSTTNKNRIESLKSSTSTLITSRLPSDDQQSKIIKVNQVFTTIEIEPPHSLSLSKLFIGKKNEQQQHHQKSIDNKQQQQKFSMMNLLLNLKGRKKTKTKMKKTERKGKTIIVTGKTATSPAYPKTLINAIENFLTTKKKI